MPNNQKDYALQYTSQIALFLCSQNMALKDIYQACNLDDTVGKDNEEKLSNKFPLFPDSHAPKPSNKELFFAEARQVKGNHAFSEGADLFLMTLMILATLTCLALIVVAPYAAAAIAAAIAVSEVRKPLMIYFIIEGAVGLIQTLGLGATIQLDRIDRNEELLREYTGYSKIEFKSVEELKEACKECHLDGIIQEIYDDLSRLPDKTTEQTDLFDKGNAERKQANKLMGKFARHHQGLFGWFIPWLTGTEAKGGHAIKQKYTQDIEKVFHSAPQVPTTTQAISSGDIAPSLDAQNPIKEDVKRKNDKNNAATPKPARPPKK